MPPPDPRMHGPPEQMGPEARTSSIVKARPYWRYARRVSGGPTFGSGGPDASGLPAPAAPTTTLRPPSSARRTHQAATLAAGHAAPSAARGRRPPGARPGGAALPTHQ